MRKAAPLLLPALGACVPAGRVVSVPGPEPQPAAGQGSPAKGETYRGRFTIGFERSSFEGCWLDLGRHSGKFEAPAPASGGVATYDIAFVGTLERSAAAPYASNRTWGGYGHVGRYDCQYKVIELISSSRVQ